MTHNPLKLIYQVLRYAVKNKHPRLRSAFTYWEDKPYSRIDLGMATYGRPFTTEQVEDVKTFFSILVPIDTCTIFMGLVFRDEKIFAIYYQNHKYNRYCSIWLLS